MSLKNSIETADDARRTLRVLLAGAYDQLDAVIEAVMSFKIDLHTEFKAMDEKLERMIEGEPAPAVAQMAEPEKAQEPEKAAEPETAKEEPDVKAAD